MGWGAGVSNVITFITYICEELRGFWGASDVMGIHVWERLVGDLIGRVIKPVVIVS